MIPVDLDSSFRGRQSMQCAVTKAKRRHDKRQKAKQNENAIESERGVVMFGQTARRWI